jgi:hypothetical protein
MLLDINGEIVTDINGDPIVITIDVTADGSAIIEISQGAPTSASGTITTGGSASLRCLRPLVASGSVLTTGSAVINDQRGLKRYWTGTDWQRSTVRAVGWNGTTWVAG